MSLFLKLTLQTFTARIVHIERTIEQEVEHPPHDLFGKRLSLPCSDPTKIKGHHVTGI